MQVSPIWHESRRLERILFVVEDITNLEALQSRLAVQSQEVMLLEDILQNDLEDFKTLLRDAESGLAAAEAILSNPAELNWLAIVRIFHTMKGNARLLGIRKLSEQLHVSEAELLALENDMTSLESAEQKVRREVSKVGETVAMYKYIFLRFAA